MQTNRKRVMFSFTTECVDIEEILEDLFCVIIVAAVDKINKMADCRFSR